MKTETINFRDFIRNDYRETYKKTTKLMSISIPTVTAFSPTAIFNPTAIVSNAYTFVFAVGGVLIGAALLERLLVLNRKQKDAKVIAGLIQTALPWLLIGGLIVFVLLNPLL
jgi:hypothetical protein